MAMLIASAQLHAQTQRSFVNLGFESPAMGANCEMQIADSTVSGGVPGWITTAPSATGAGCGAITGPLTGPLIEIWSTAFNSVTSREGNQFAELNAQVASRLYQNICLNSGETIGWTFSHRGRQSATVADIAQFRIGSTAGTNRIVSASDTTTGALGSNNGYNCFAADGSITSNTCTRTSGGNGWSDYSGTFTWSGANGPQAVGFEAISSAGGNDSIGNFLDNVQLTLTPYVEFASSTYTANEGATFTQPQILVLGTVPTGGITVTINLAGTATLGTDYTKTSGGATTVTVSVPAGVYATPTGFNIPLSLVNDTIIENNETIAMTLATSSTYFIAASGTCGGVANSSSTLTIVDNDVDLVATKSVSASTPAAGTSVTYTVTFANNTAKTTVAPTTAHDVTAAISDPAPTNLTFASWTCTASNGASCPGGTSNGTTSGSGSISGNAVLPAGSAAAGGKLTYAITAAIASAACGSPIQNTATIAVPAGFDEGTSVQSGFTSPAPGGATDDTASATITPVCQVNVTISKTDSSNTYTPGSTGVYTISVSNTGPSTASGIKFTDALPAGLSLNGAWTCSGAGGSTCSAASGTTTAALNALTVTVAPGTAPPGSSTAVTIQVPVIYSSNVSSY